MCTIPTAFVSANLTLVRQVISNNQMRNEISIKRANIHTHSRCSRRAWISYPTEIYVLPSVFREKWPNRPVIKSVNREEFMYGNGTLSGETDKFMRTEIRGIVGPPLKGVSHGPWQEFSSKAINFIWLHRKARDGFVALHESLRRILSGLFLGIWIGKKSIFSDKILIRIIQWN